MVTERLKCPYFNYLEVINMIFTPTLIYRREMVEGGFVEYWNLGELHGNVLHSTKDYPESFLNDFRLGGNNLYDLHLEYMCEKKRNDTFEHIYILAQGGCVPGYPEYRTFIPDSGQKVFSRRKFYETDLDFNQWPEELKSRVEQLPDYVTSILENSTERIDF
jgi:hypothetical protein